MIDNKMSKWRFHGKVHSSYRCCTGLATVGLESKTCFSTLGAALATKWDRICTGVSHLSFLLSADKRNCLLFLESLWWSRKKVGLGITQTRAWMSVRARGLELWHSFTEQLEAGCFRSLSLSSFTCTMGIIMGLIIHLLGSWEKSMQYKWSKPFLVHVSDAFLIPWLSAFLTKTERAKEWQSYPRPCTTAWPVALLQPN